MFCLFPCRSDLRIATVPSPRRILKLSKNEKLAEKSWLLHQLERFSMSDGGAEREGKSNRDVRFVFREWET